MNQYEQLLEIMKKMGSKTNPEELQLAEAVSSTEIQVGGNKLDTDDYKINENIKDLKAGVLVLVYKIRDDLYIIICKVV